MVKKEELKQDDDKGTGEGRMELRGSKVTS